MAMESDATQLRPPPFPVPQKFTPTPHSKPKSPTTTGHITIAPLPPLLLPSPRGPCPPSPTAAVPRCDRPRGSRLIRLPAAVAIRRASGQVPDQTDRGTHADNDADRQTEIERHLASQILFLRIGRCPLQGPWPYYSHYHGGKGEDEEQEEEGVGGTQERMEGGSIIHKHTSHPPPRPSQANLTPLPHLEYFTIIQVRFIWTWKDRGCNQC